MNKIAEEIRSYLGSAALSDEEFLEHYGTKRHSGRYPWGSGDDPYQHSDDFISRIEIAKRDRGFTETAENIRKEFGLSTTEYRKEKSIALDQRRQIQIDKAKSLSKDGLGPTAIAKALGLPPSQESTIRGWLEQEEKGKYKQAQATADFLRQQVDEKRMIDVGAAVELTDGINVSRTKFDNALKILEKEGYHVYNGRVPQPTNKNQMTTLKVLCAPDVEHKEIYDYDKIKTIKEYITRDNGQTYELKFHYPASMDSKRIKVMLKDEIGPDGLPGVAKDGLIQIRRGVPDLDLGESRYSQVRILVDGNKYLKGMAVYSDDIPDGYDLVFNSNKKTREDAFKKIKDDPENPFGSAIKDADQGGQYWYDAKTGKRCSANDPNVKDKRLGLINKRADEGDWTEWKDALPSQFLAKQSQQLITKQLTLAKVTKDAEYEEIMSLTNPTIKKYYLQKFADECDSAAVDLKAAALPGQKYHVIVPINTMKENEIFAPQYANGTQLALVRYPHGGTFEIPVLTVNNKNKLAEKVIGKQSIDAVGITAGVASILSGADFDGDTVMCIPTNDKKGKVKIQHTEPFPGLKGFDTGEYQYDKHIPASESKDGLDHYYRNGKEFSVMKNTNTQMGIISNLITDMTIQGATNDELERAVKHSMVVIDAEKHKLNYQQSYKDNNIESLQLKYQPKAWNEKGEPIDGGGASTIFSRSKGVEQVLKRNSYSRVNIKGKSWYDPSKPEGAVLYTNQSPERLYYARDQYDKKTGLTTIWTTSGEKITYNKKDKEQAKLYSPVMHISKKGDVTFTNPAGNISYQVKARTQDIPRMSNTDDAYSLISTSRHPKEIIYADYANHMKALANKARKSIAYSEKQEENPQAKKIYAKELSSLMSKLNTARKNSPIERQATRTAYLELDKYMKDHPDTKPDKQRQIAQRAMTKARIQTGAQSRRERSITITDREWEAIQAGAVSENKLTQILNNADADSLRQRAMPKQSKTLNGAQIARIHALSNSGSSLSEIAAKMNISTASVSKYLKGVE